MKLILQIITLLLFCSTVNADDSAKVKLNDFFKNLKTLSADFEQTVQNSQLNAVEKASGKLWIQRPGKFRWNYDKPYIQEIVSNGEKLWIYDADLEQVTIKKISSTLGNTPALLLSSDKPLSESFSIETLETDLALTWVQLTPKDSEAGFNSIRLGFSKNTLEKMLLEDNLGQTTHLIFSELTRNVTVNPDLFDFSPPKGADIFDNSN